jgi:pimeloyl-ACP methyl ester carboxylesterase
LIYFEGRWRPNFEHERQEDDPMNKRTKQLLWIGAGLAGIAAVNNAIFTRAKAQGNPLGGEGRFWPGPYGDIFYTRQGKGQPVVLIHGIYAGASSYEWRKNFDNLSEHFQIYALDWLGFGLSDKPRIRYSAAMYIEQLKQFLQEVVGEPCTLVASSLGAAYAVQAANDLPDLVQSLVLVCPTGFRRLSSPPDTKSEAIYQTLYAPLVGTTFYNALTSVPSLRHYLMNEAYFDPSYVDDAMVDHYSTTTHQYGSQNAPPAFISGLLNQDISETFPTLPQKLVRIIWGREARRTPLSDAEAFLAANPRAELTVFDKSGSLPQDEQAQGFNRLLVELLNQDKPKASRSRAKKQEKEDEV